MGCNSRAICQANDPNAQTTNLCHFTTFVRFVSNTKTNNGSSRNMKIEEEQETIDERMDAHQQFRYRADVGTCCMLYFLPSSSLHSDARKRAKSFAFSRQTDGGYFFCYQIIIIIANTHKSNPAKINLGSNEFFFRLPLLVYHTNSCNISHPSGLIHTFPEPTVTSAVMRFAVIFDA